MSLQQTETSNETHPASRQPILGKRIRAIATSTVLLSMVLLASYGFYYIVNQTLNPGSPNDNWLLSVLQQHYAATLGVPMSAVAALCIVLLLETAAGPIEIETPWLKFRGAAAPVILWVLCFLAMTFALSWLWEKKSTDPEVQAGPQSNLSIQSPFEENTFDNDSHKIFASPGTRWRISARPASGKSAIPLRHWATGAWLSNNSRC
jgi:hypothetical protein